jgi:hypothetical protein
VSAVVFVAAGAAEIAGSEVGSGLFGGVVVLVSVAVTVAEGFSTGVDVACCAGAGSVTGAVVVAGLLRGGAVEPVYSISFQQPDSKKIGATVSPNRIQCIAVGMDSCRCHPEHIEGILHSCEESSLRSD